MGKQTLVEMNHRQEQTGRFATSKVEWLNEATSADFYIESVEVDGDYLANVRAAS